MQRADPSSRVSNPEPRAAIRPATAFLALLLLIATVGAVLFLTRPDPATPATGTRPAAPDFSLTDEEAIARFKELELMRQEIYESLDSSLIPEALHSDSPLIASARKDINQLIRDGVLDETTYQTRSIVIRSNGESEIVIRQGVVQAPTFIARDTGEEIGTTSDRFFVLVDWTLRLDGSEWLIYDSNVVRSRKLAA
jgi:hypothetical protein